jgi:hypothetical protein
LCFGSVLCVSFKFVHHGGHRGNTAQALDRWWHPVASSEALDVPHAIPLLAMAITISSDSPEFFVAADSLSPTTIAN